MCQSKDVQDFLGNVVNKVVVKITGGKNSTGINGFVFDVTGDEEMQFDSDITDHYIEKNSSIQDHIALKPRRYTVSGFVGELSDKLAQTISNALSTVTGLSIVGPYLPQWSEQATQLYAKVGAEVQQAASFAQHAVNAADGIYALFQGASTTLTKQQAAYFCFLNLWQNQRYMQLNLCTIETPWDTLYNMAVENVRILQKDSSNMVSEFSVTFKEMRFIKINPYTPDINQTLSTQGAQVPELLKSIKNMNEPEVAIGPTSGSGNDYKGNTLDFTTLQKDIPL